MEYNKENREAIHMSDINKSTKAVEDLSLIERVKLAESFTAFQGIAVGNLIDAMDTINAWCVAEVLSVDGDDISVTYDGWTPKYDTVFLFHLSCRNSN